MKRSSYSRIDPRRGASADAIHVKRVHWLWISLLSLWAMFLSGILSDLAGSPGLIQSYRLHSLLQSRQHELSGLETQIARMDLDRRRLEENTVVQEREIRRVLGYAAKDELIFDFSLYPSRR